MAYQNLSSVSMLRDRRKDGKAPNGGGPANLLLLEFLVDRLALIDDRKDGTTRISFQFLDYEPLELSEADFVSAGLRKEARNGKSCLFPMLPEQEVGAKKDFNVNVEVYRKTDNVTLGRCAISILNLFKEVMETTGSKIERPSATMKDSFEIFNRAGEVIGIVVLHIRMSCFGKQIITQFQLDVKDGGNESSKERRPTETKLSLKKNAGCGKVTKYCPPVSTTQTILSPPNKVASKHSNVCLATSDSSCPSSVSTSPIPQQPPMYPHQPFPLTNSNISNQNYPYYPFYLYAQPSVLEQTIQAAMPQLASQLNALNSLNQLSAMNPIVSIGQMPLPQTISSYSNPPKPNSTPVSLPPYQYPPNPNQPPPNPNQGRYDPNMFFNYYPVNPNFPPTPPNPY